jgi:hypothetical protein
MITWYGISGGVISSSQTLLHTQDNTTYKQETYIHAPNRILTHDPSNQAAKPYVLVRTAMGSIGLFYSAHVTV